MRFPAALRRDPRVEAWFSTADPHRLVVRQWFDKMRACGADVRETLHDGWPVACIGDAAFGYVAAFRAHANVGFFRGADLPDPAGLLEGSGRLMRHVKIRPGRPLDDGALAALIAEACADMRRRIADAPAPGAKGLGRIGVTSREPDGRLRQ